MLSFVLLVSVASMVSAMPQVTTDVPHHHPATPFFIIAKMDAELCSAAPADLASITKSPFDEACKAHKPTDPVCICKKPTPEKLKMLQDWLVAEGKKPLPVNANGFIPRCGVCDKDNKWEPVHL